LIHIFNNNHPIAGHITNPSQNKTQNIHRFTVRSLWSLDISLRIDCAAHMFHALIPFIALPKRKIQTFGDMAMVR